MSGFAKPPAADGAPWIGPEHNQQTTQAKKKPQSFGERLRHKGRHYLKKAPRFLHTQNKQPLLARWRSNSVKVKTDIDYQSPPPPDPPMNLGTMDAKPKYNIQSQGPQPIPRTVWSPPLLDLEAKNAKNELQACFMFPVQQQQQQQPWPASIPQPAAAADNTSSSDAEGHIVKPSNHRRWLKGYTASRKRVNSAPALSLGLGDLTGVGSQYDATNRPTSALPIRTDQIIAEPGFEQINGNMYIDHTDGGIYVSRDIHRPIG